MNAPSEIIRHSDLLNRLVIERSTTEKVGYLEQLWVDPQSHRVGGLTCKSGLLGHNKHTFTWAQIETIGDDCIFVNRSPEDAASKQSEKVESVIGRELWTDAGNKAGKLVDYLLNPRTGIVVGYLFVSNGWRGVLDGIYLLEPVAISSVGNQRAIALEAAIQNAQQYSEGIHQKLEQTRDFLKKDYDKTKRDVEAALGKTQAAGDKLRDATQSASRQAQEKFSQAKAQPQDSSQPTASETGDDSNSQL